MADLPLTAFDVAVLLIVGISGLLALVRGATREALTMAAWIGALVVAYYGFGYVRELAQKTIEMRWIADVVALVVVFVVPLIAFKTVAVGALGPGLRGRLRHGRPAGRHGVRRGARRGDRLRALSRRRDPDRARRAAGLDHPGGTPALCPGRRRPAAGSAAGGCRGGGPRGGARGAARASCASSPRHDGPARVPGARDRGEHVDHIATVG